MITQTLCPICHTIFRVAENTLLESNGIVQCGVCGMVFNALEHWVESKPEQIYPPVIIPQEPLFNQSLQQEPFIAVAPIPEVEQIRLPSSTPLALPLAGAEMAAIQTDLNLPGLAVESDIPFITESAEPLDFKNVNVKKHSLLYSSMSFLLGLVLLAQLGYFYRDQIAVAWPASKPELVEICQLLHCKITLPHDSNLLRINSSEFKIDPLLANRIQVRLAIENLTDTPIAYPDIALTLSNEADEAIVKRNFQPREYFQKNTAIAGGLAAQAEVVVNLTLDVSNISVSNYKVLLFYPD